MDKGSAHLAFLSIFWNCKILSSPNSPRMYHEEDILAFLTRSKNEKLVEVYMIEVNLSTIDPSSWVLNTRCGSHLCNDMKVLEMSRRLTKGEVVLRVRNGAKVAASVVGTFTIPLPCRLILELGGQLCSFSKREMHYGARTHSNGLYILDPKIPILNIEVKKAKKYDPKLSYIWHCRLGHINETRLTKVHKQGYIDPFNYESYGTCECCLLGKMTKSPFTKKSERAGVLLRLVHSNVCGPMNTSARGGYSYFITFTDNHSCYGYDYLKENGILAQWTPPRIPQHNGVFKRRNRTLLDMIRSMMSHVFVSRHVTFLEKEFLNEKASGSKVVLEEVRDPQIDIPLELEPEIVTSDIQPQSLEAQPLKRSSRIL
ncbi:GAG-pre-integrase domain - like 2 [Theobroma cacao]|nr:GAG-pre-integrase domain - like 2 [Theobroma cacao]